MNVEIAHNCNYLYSEDSRGFLQLITFYGLSFLFALQFGSKQRDFDCLIERGFGPQRITLAGFIISRKVIKVLR